MARQQRTETRASSRAQQPGESASPDDGDDDDCDDDDDVGDYDDEEKGKQESAAVGRVCVFWVTMAMVSIGMVIAMVMRMKNGINTREAKREKLDEPLQTSGLLNYLLLRLLDVRFNFNPYHYSTLKLAYPDFWFSTLILSIFNK